MDLDALHRAEKCSVIYGGEVLWTRCMTCEAPLLKPHRKYRATCSNTVACFLRSYRHHVRAQWAAYRSR